MSVVHLTVTQELFDYIRSVSTREPEILARLREETAPHPQVSCQITPEQGQFMALLVRLMGAKRTLEVGVFTGYSSLSVALALPEDGRMVACDVNAEFTAVARRYWREAGVEHKIDLRLAPALGTLDQLLAEGPEESFDFAFIDADKANYWNYFERCLKLVRRGGLIAVDNVLWSGRVADQSNQEPDTRNMREFNERVYRDERVDISVLPLSDGLTLARKR